MKNYYIPLFFFLLFIVACNPSDQEVEAEMQDQLVLKPFSDTGKVDTFKVSLKGRTMKDLIINFTITSYNGQLIYSKNFKGKDLVDNYKSTVDLKKEQSQLTFIKNEYKLFLDDENFLEPAVTENENPDQYAPDKLFFEELKQSALNGFKYRTGKETSVYIAWSRKEEKVKPYYICCK